MPSPEEISRIEDGWGRVGEESRERFDSPSRADFEARAVKHVLRGLGLSTAEAFLSGQARELTGDPTISFALLHHMVPGFPIRLGVAKLYYLEHTLTFAGLFRRPAKNPVYRAFHEWAEEDPTDDDRRRGIIFRLPGCPGNANRAILHTYPVPFEGAMTRVTFGVEERRETVLYVLEPLDQLLDALKRTYRPDEYA